MQLKDLENKILKKYNIPLSYINRPVHFRIPEYYLTNNNTCLSFDKKSYSNMKQSLVTSLPNSISFKNITKEREKKILLRKQKIEKSKIDLLIFDTYDKINNKIRLQDEYIPIKNSKMQLISKYFKEKLEKNLMTQKVVTNPLNIKKNNHLKKQYSWSQKFLEYIKMEEYKKLYRIKHINNINIHRSIDNMIKNRNNKRSNIKNFIFPNIIKFNSPLSSAKKKFKHKRCSKIVIPINNLIENDKNSVENNSFYNTHLENYTPIKSIKYNKKW